MVVKAKNVLITLLIASYLSATNFAFGMQILGTVVGPHQQAIANAKLQVVNSTGRVVATVVTDLKGSYKLSGLANATYTVTIDPSGTPYKGNQVIGDLQTNDLCLDWTLSSNIPAQSTQRPAENGVCDPVWWDSTAALAVLGGLALLGAGIGTGIAIASGDDDCGCCRQPVSPAQ